jgi:RNA polymerase sigma-70 factor (ECF subfamily)
VAELTESADLDLILQLQKGDLQALGGLYDRHRNLVFRTALGITGDAEAAADLLHDTFLRLYRFGHRIDPNRPIEPWLYRMAANMAYTWVKRRGRWMQALREMAEKLARESQTSPSQQVERNEAWAEVRKALQGISPEKRVVVVLYYINDLSINEIAEILELPTGTVKSRLHYGRQALREHLGLEGTRVPKVGYEAT